MPAPPVQLAREVIAMARNLGLAACGVCRAEPTRWRAELEQWIAAGMHGEMDYLADEIDAKLDPNVLLNGVCSAVVVADQYASRGDADAPQIAFGKVARYARGRDYHKVIKDRLHAISDALRERFPNERFRAFVDTAPILEREFAARAALGWVGKHTLLIHPRLGSYLLLGGILTTLQLEPPPEQEAVTDHCGTCTRCIDACPTSAITPYSIDARRCISYLTIERRSPVEREWWDQIGDWVYGCDICQEVCPHNSPRSEGADVGEARAEYAPRRNGFALAEMLGWTEEDRRRAFTGTAMWRATLSMMKRNALIAAGNAIRSGASPGLRANIERVAWDASEPDDVRAFARQVLEWTSPSEPEA